MLNISDKIENMYLLKKRMLVFNVLLRKAIEKGGVHPIYIDNLSGRYANKIEACMSETEWQLNFPNEMIDAYCDLIKSQTVPNYHPLIQNCILYIEQHYAEMPNLSSLA